MQVLFVRHGESEANRANVIVSYQGDPALTTHGLEEARRMAEMWGAKMPTAVYASPLKRTQQTAQAFLRPGMSLRVDDRLHEIALGRWDGRAIPDIEAEDGERYRQWKHDPELGAPGGGEALSQVATRIGSFLEEVQSAHPDGLVVAVTHSDCMKALILSVLEAPWKSSQWVHLTNTGGLLVERRDGRWQLMVYPLAP